MQLNNQKVLTMDVNNPDYLQFVDEYIKQLFEGRNGYFLTDILIAQLIKELRKFNDTKDK